MTRPTRALFAAPRRYLVVPAVGLALLAERLCADARAAGAVSIPSQAWALFALAAVLFAVAMGRPPRLGFATAPPLRAVAGARRASILLLAAGLCAIVAAPLFWIINAATEDAPAGEPANTGAWLLWIAALLLFGARFALWERQAPAPLEAQPADPPADRLPRRVEWALLAGLLALALALRLPGLETTPPGLWFDEAQNGLVAEQLLAPGATHATFVAENTQMGALPLYFLGLILRVSGHAIWPLRVEPALAGAAIAPLLYLLAARLYGWRVGLAAGALVALSAWNITFSRLGLLSMGTVVFDVLTYVCIAQALRTGRLGYYAGAGVALGLALQMYYVARLAPLLLLALLAHRIVGSRGRILRAMRSGLLVFAVGAALAFLPVGLFAIQQPALFAGRVSDVSVFNPSVGGGDSSAFTGSLNKHLAMFNIAGDQNGRHDLPGAPMLDDVTAALFFLGLGLCVVRAGRWQYIFPPLWFAAALAGGVLSLPFEAPQSHRTLENSIVTALCAGIVLGEFWQALTRAPIAAPQDPAPAPAARPARAGWRGLRRRPAPATTSLPVRVRGARPVVAAGAPPATAVADRAPNAVSATSLAAPARPVVRVSPAVWLVSGLGIAAVAVVVGSVTIPRYFQLQMQSRQVWEEMSAAQQVAGQTLKRYSATDLVYLSPVYLGLPSVKYIAPGAEGQEWPGMQALPLSSTDARGATIVLDPPSAADISSLPAIYPHAQIQPLRAPSDPAPLAYVVRVPAEDIAGLHGVRAGVQPAGGSAPAPERALSDFTFDWSKATAGVARLTATLQTTAYGPYSFDWQTAGPKTAGALTVDGRPVTPGVALPLAVGLHTVVATDTLSSGTGTARLLWAPPGQPTPAPVPAAALFDPQRIEPHGLTGYYRRGPTGEGPPDLARVDPVISFYFQHTALERPYHVEWRGRLYAPQAGVYTLSTEQLSSSTLTLDGEEVLVNRNPNSLQGVTRPLTAGWHSIKLAYLDDQGYSHMYLYWTPPGYPQSIIPSAFLWPDLGQYPTAPAGGWPTLSGSQSGAAPGGPPPTAAPASAAPPDSGPAGPAGRPLNPSVTLGLNGAPLPHPRGAAVDSAGNLYILTELDSQIHVFTPDGKPVTSWAVAGADGQPLIEGSALLFENGRLLALDAASASLMAYDLTGKSLGKTRLCDCFYPRAVAPAQGGGYWVADTGAGRVLKVNATGATTLTVGGKGSGPGQFVEPAGVAQGSDGTLYVADVGNSRVQSFTPEGKPVAQWAVGASIARDGVRLAAAGADVLVAQTEAQAIVRYDGQGHEQGRWQFRPATQTFTPSGLTALGDGRFIALYLQENVVAVFTPGK